MPDVASRARKSRPRQLSPHRDSVCRSRWPCAPRPGVSAWGLCIFGWWAGVRPREASMTESTSTAGVERGAKNRRRKGLVIINTGNGKGKTTAAFGLGLRASGNRMKVFCLQFIKGAWKTGETEAVKLLAPNFELFKTGRGWTIDRIRDHRISDEEHQAAAQEGLAWARERILSGEYQIVILDEILGSIKA